MSITDLREDLQALHGYVEAGDRARAIQTIDQALKEIDGDRLLTTTEAAELLGVRSITTVKLWLRQGFIKSEMRGNRAMIPLSEVERVRDVARVRHIRVMGKLHEASAEFGVPEGLSDEELQSLSASRPGRLPWQR